MTAGHRRFAAGLLGTAVLLVAAAPPARASGEADKGTADKDTADKDTADKDTADKDTADHDSAHRDSDGLSKADLRLYRRLSRPRGSYANLMLAVALGRGLRLNNPFRLQTQLGDTPQSLSLTATYGDLGLAVALGDPNGLQHGVAAHLSVAFDGVAQQAISAGYAIFYRPEAPVIGYARLGPALILTPDPNLGGELAVGGAVYFTGALGLTSELVGDLYYGAGTWERERTAVPVISAQAGLFVDFEVLP